jgi:hypothetical protein
MVAKMMLAITQVRLKRETETETETETGKDDA